MRERDQEDGLRGSVGLDYIGTSRPCLRMLNFILKAMRGLWWTSSCFKCLTEFYLDFVKDLSESVKKIDFRKQGKWKKG